MEIRRRRLQNLDAVLRSPWVCFGHRGAKGHEPENTLRSVRRALELGCKAIEVDVHRVGNGSRLAVIHDETLDRTTDGVGSLSERTWNYVRACDAGCGERVPSLQEVIRCVRGRAILNVELKGEGTAKPVADALAKRVLGGDPPELFLVSSFSASMLEEFRGLLPGVPIGVLLPDASESGVQCAVRLRAFSVHPEASSVTSEFVARCHRNNLRVFAYTVNRLAEARRLRDLGVHGVFTDFPDRLQAVCNTPSLPEPTTSDKPGSPH